MSKGVLFIISGPSGTGKGTVCSQLIERGDVFLSVSSTTRDKRAGEIDGVTYNFTTIEKFRDMIERGDMLEWAQYNSNYYGTPAQAVEQRLSEGKNVILEIEPQGAFKVQAKMPEAVLIFIVPPSMDSLKQRLVTRGRETKEQIEKRLAAAAWEFRQARRYDYIVENNELEKCVDDIAGIMSDVVKMRRKVDALIESTKNI